MPDALHVAFVRSAALGALAAIDTRRASAMPGVALTITGAELRDLPPLSVNPLVPDLRIPRAGLLAQDRTNFVGQPIAAVIAASLHAARDAAEAIEATVRDDAGPDAIECFSQRWAQGDTEQAFAEAAHIVRERVAHPRLAPMALEPRAALARWDETAGRLTVWLSTQTPHRARETLARLLGLDETRVRVIAPDVGGAFGGKASIHPEEIVVAWAALHLKRPVRWCATRGEEMLGATQGRGSVLEGELALAADGRMLALRARVAAPLGAWLPFSATVPARNAARILPGPYVVPAVDIAMRGTTDAHAPVGIYRGAGRPEAAMLMERLADAAARALHLDPAELRRRNLVPAARMPWRTPTGETLDSGDFASLLATAQTSAGYAALIEQRDARRRAGGIAGVGIALYVEPCGQGWERARIALRPDGTLVAATGATAQGQGRETALRRILAAVLPLPADRIVIRHGDTDATPVGIGALASRGTAIGGSAMLVAAHALLAAARRHAAELIGANGESLVVTRDGLVDGQRLVTWAELAGSEELREEIRYDAPGEAWSSGCCIALLSVDRDTGRPRVEQLTWIDDAGVVVDPVLVEGQLRGGLAQGLGEALFERVVYDDAGQLLTGSLMDYAVPRARDIPPVRLGSIATPSPVNALGAKGVGEAGCIGVPAAIVNAALDALSVFGVAALDPPLTAEKLWRAMRDGATMPPEGRPSP